MSAVLMAQIGKLKKSLRLKQDSLVSGANIKTVNKKSLVGEGDVNLPGVSKYPIVSDVDENALNIIRSSYSLGRIFSEDEEVVFLNSSENSVVLTDSVNGWRITTIDGRSSGSVKSLKPGFPLYGRNIYIPSVQVPMARMRSGWAKLIAEDSTGNKLININSANGEYKYVTFNSQGLVSSSTTQDTSRVVGVHEYAEGESIVVEERSSSYSTISLMSTGVTTPSRHVINSSVGAEKSTYLGNGYAIVHIRYGNGCVPIHYSNNTFSVGGWGYIASNVATSYFTPVATSNGRVVEIGTTSGGGSLLTYIGSVSGSSTPNISWSTGDSGSYVYNNGPAFIEKIAQDTFLCIFRAKSSVNSGTNEYEMRMVVITYSPSTNTTRLSEPYLYNSFRGTPPDNINDYRYGGRDGNRYGCAVVSDNRWMVTTSSGISSFLFDGEFIVPESTESLSYSYNANAGFVKSFSGESWFVTDNTKFTKLELGTSYVREEFSVNLPAKVFFSEGFTDAGFSVDGIWYAVPSPSHLYMLPTSETKLLAANSADAGIYGDYL